MVADVLGHNDDYRSLPAVLATAARRASDTRVVVYAAAGIAIVTSAIALRPFAWTAFAAAGACIGAFGAWGIADREVRDRGDATSRSLARLLWRTLRGVAALLGAAGAALLLFLLLSIGLGTWTS